MPIFLQSTVLTNEIEDTISQITPETQFTVLENFMTPLCHIPYDKQLIKKQYWANTISKELRSRLHNAKTPIKLPKVHPISPAVCLS